MAHKVMLKLYNVRSDIFDAICTDFRKNVRVVNDFDTYLYGYASKDEQKTTLISDGKDSMVVPSYIVDYYTDIPDASTWRQIIITRNENFKLPIQESIHGFEAFNFLNKILLKYYSEEEIDQCLRDHSMIVGNMKQFHYYVPTDKGVITEYPNTFKYDINGAHCDSLREIFPRAASDFENLYNKRWMSIRYKQIPNYYIGMLGKEGSKYRGTYNWIVNRTSQLLIKAHDELGGDLIYANTDGLIVNNPKKLLNTSKALGGIKLEYQGTTFVYQDTNYKLFQMGDTMKGTCLTSVRSLIDLSKNKVVHYNKERIGAGYKAINVKEEVLSKKKHIIIK